MRLLSLCCAGVLLVQMAWADQVIMKSGDRVTGSIVKKDGDTLTVNGKDFGEVKLKWPDVAEIQTEQPINVVLSSGQTVKGVISSQNGRVQVGGQSAVLADVTALRNDAEQAKYEKFLHPGLLDLWTVNGSINIAGTKGNAETSTLTTPFNFVRASNTSRTTAYFNSIRATATVGGVNAQTARAVRGGWGYNHNITKKIFFNGFNDYDYDKFQSLDLRVVLGGGLGYSIWSDKNGQLGVVAGGAWNREAFSASGSQAAFTRHSGEGYWGDDFNYKLNSRANVTQAFRMFNNLSDTGQYRLNFDTGMTMQLVKWLNWNLALSDRYLSNPPIGRKKNDFLYSTGFGFSFAR